MTASPRLVGGPEAPRTVRPLRLALVSLVLIAAAGHAHGGEDPNVACQREIAKRSTRFVQTKLRALQKCEDAILQGRIPGPCPDEKASQRIARAATKLTTATRQRCGGSDRGCGTEDDLGLAAIGWDIGTCPGFGELRCINAITSCADVPTCAR